MWTLYKIKPGIPPFDEVSHILSLNSTFARQLFFFYPQLTFAEAFFAAVCLLRCHLCGHIRIWRYGSRRLRLYRWAGSASTWVARQKTPWQVSIHHCWWQLIVSYPRAPFMQTMTQPLLSLSGDLIGSPFNAFKLTSNQMAAFLQLVKFILS